MQSIVLPADRFSRTVKHSAQAQYILSCHDIMDITTLSSFFGFFVIADCRYFEKALFNLTSQHLLKILIFEFLDSS